VIRLRTYAFFLFRGITLGLFDYREKQVSRSLSRLQALTLGLVVLCGAGLGIAGLFAVGSRGWFGRDAMHVRVGFKEIRGVEVGTRVRIQGIDAGEVVEIQPPAQADGPVILRMRLKGQLRHLVRPESTVQIVSEGMIGGKALEIRPPAPGRAEDDGKPIQENALLRSEPTAELADLVKGIQNGEGTLGKLVKDPQAYDKLIALIDKSKDAADASKDTLAAIQRDADAVKKLPLIGKYVEDPVALLVRKDCERNRQSFAEDELFEPGRAALTASGRDKLDQLGPWLTGLRHKGSEVVVVSYADPKKGTPPAALQITKLQSEAVADYLKKKHAAHKLGRFSSRKVTALGQGFRPPPEPEKERLPSARVEVLVFVPQG
jgi:phospholipid/cholesterol/gamma-HCH transport system substrate-binding protein